MCVWKPLAEACAAVPPEARLTAQTPTPVHQAVFIHTLLQPADQCVCVCVCVCVYVCGYCFCNPFPCLCKVNSRFVRLLQ